jgi:predicted transcriptional regulator
MNAWLTEISVKRRDKLSIISEIMEISKTGALKTQIMYKANLSFAQLKDYLKLLEKISLLKKTVANGKEVYTATERGSDFLNRHCEIIDLLNENGNNRSGFKSPSINLLRKTTIRV